MLEACGPYPAEEVYAACRFGRAHLYLCPEGWVVLERYIREDTGEAELLVLLAYGEAYESLFHKYNDELETLARNCGAKTLAFRRIKDSPWGTYGWKMRAVEYVKEV